MESDDELRGDLCSFAEEPVKLEFLQINIYYHITEGDQISGGTGVLMILIFLFFVSCLKRSPWNLDKLSAISFAADTT